MERIKQNCRDSLPAGVGAKGVERRGGNGIRLVGTKRE